MSQDVPTICLPPSAAMPQNLPRSAYTNSISNDPCLKSRLPLEKPSLVEGGDSRKQIENTNLKLRTKLSERGEFRELPAEVRFKIWQYLMPEVRDEPECAREPYGSWTTKSPRHGNRLAILRTSCALKVEIEEEIYRSRVLRISIRPRWKGWRAEDLPGSNPIDFANTKFAKFESIKVEIHCPEKGDPGQLLYVRAAVLDLVCALKGLGADIQHCEPYSRGVDFRKLESQGKLAKPGSLIERDDHNVNAAKIPKLQIVFLNTGTDTWYEDRSIRATLGGHTYLYNDLDLLLAPFGYLFNIQQIKFKFPEIPLSHGLRRFRGITISEIDAPRNHCAQLLRLCQYVRRQALSSHLFELDGKGPTQSFFEADVERYLFLDKSLDTAPGPTAAILRRERLIHNRWYRKTFKHILNMHRQRTEDDEEVKVYAEAAEARYRDFECLDRSYHDHGWKLHVTQDPSWLKEWRRYWPNGIPLRGTPEWDACIAAARR